MMQCSVAIRKGVDDFNAGASIEDCPYEPLDEPEYQEATHGAVVIGKVRVAIDFREMWKIGWNLGEMVRHARKSA